jgi:ribosomal protein S18 acetylase RimI-like enzyme
MAIALRACRDEDVPAVLALWQRAEAVPRPTDRPDALRVRLQRDRELFVLAWDGDHLVGSLIGGWDGWRGNMYRLAVDPAYRRQGIAARLVAEVEARLRDLGAERITSLVFVDEPGAAPFWREVGYAPDPNTARYVKTLLTASDGTGSQIVADS